MMDSTMPRRDDDSENWGGARPGAGKPAKDPAEKIVTLSLTVRAALKQRFTKLSDAQRKQVRDTLVAELERLVAEAEQ